MYDVNINKPSLNPYDIQSKIINLQKIFTFLVALFKKSDKVDFKVLVFITLAYQSINKGNKLGLDISSLLIGQI